MNLCDGTSFPHALGIGLALQKLEGKARAESLHFFLTEPLFLIRFGLRSAASKPGGQAGAESPHFFSTEPHFLIPFDSLPAVQEVTTGASEVFRREPVFLMPWSSDGQPRKLGGKARAESLHSFSTEPLFLIPFGSLPGRPGGDVRRE